MILHTAQQLKSGAHFMKNFFSLIQIRWKIGFSVSPLYGIISLQNFAHATKEQQ